MYALGIPVQEKGSMAGVAVCLPNPSLPVLRLGDQLPPAQQRTAENLATEGLLRRWLAAEIVRHQDRYRQRHAIYWERLLGDGISVPDRRAMDTLAARLQALRHGLVLANRRIRRWLQVLRSGVEHGDGVTLTPMMRRASGTAATVYLIHAGVPVRLVAAYTGASAVGIWQQAARSGVRPDPLALRVDAGPVEHRSLRRIRDATIRRYCAASRCTQVAVARRSGLSVRQVARIVHAIEEGCR